MLHTSVISSNFFISIKLAACDQTNSLLFMGVSTELIPHNLTPRMIKGITVVSNLKLLVSPHAATIPVGFGSIWLTPRIKEFMDKYPEMEVEVIVTDKELDLSTREADVAIWMRPPTQLSYIQKKLIDINYHIYGSPKYLEENGYPNTIKDLDKHKFIVYGKGTPSPLSQTDWILKVGKKDSTKRKSVMRVNNIYSLLLAVESGVGLAALPDYMVQEKSTLVKVLPNVDGPKYEAHFVYPQSLKNVARIKSFRDFIFDKVNEWRF